MELNKSRLAEGKKEKFFIEGAKVQYRNYGNKAQKWKYGTIVSRSGTLYYDIIDNHGRILRRHIDQVLRTKERLLATLVTLRLRKLERNKQSNQAFHPFRLNLLQRNPMICLKSHLRRHRPISQSVLELKYFQLLPSREGLKEQRNLSFI